MSEKVKYEDDPRPECKYSIKCYQKNPEHAKKYKHPPTPKKLFSIFNVPSSKRIKLDDSAEKVVPNEEPEQSSNKEIENTKDSKPVIDKNSKSDEKVTNEHPNNKPEHKNGAEIKYHSLPQNIPEFIESKFLVKMPEDFYSFWKFYKSSNWIESFMKKIDLKLVGPFDVLSETLPVREKDEDYLVHWRFYFDPPEFQTIIVSQKKGCHFGYYRDSPSELPCLVASMKDDFKITPIGENIFGALISFIDSVETKSFSFIPKKDYDDFVEKLKNWAHKHKFDIGISTVKTRTRQKEAVCRPFHGVGIVVPYNSKTQLGYRPLSETDANIKKILNRLKNGEDEDDKKASFVSLQPIINMANIATDECDFGTGLELGIDLFCCGDPFLHNAVKRLLSVAYQMLDRDQFEIIIMAHLENRRKGFDLSAANLP